MYIYVPILGLQRESLWVALLYIFVVELLVFESNMCTPGAVNVLFCVDIFFYAPYINFLSLILFNTRPNQVFFFLPLLSSQLVYFGIVSLLRQEILIENAIKPPSFPRVRHIISCYPHLLTSIQSVNRKLSSAPSNTGAAKR